MLATTVIAFFSESIQEHYTYISNFQKEIGEQEEWSNMLLIQTYTNKTYRYHQIPSQY